MKVNTDSIVNTLIQLVRIPSPSGNTDKIIEWISSELDKFNVAYYKTNKGALVATIDGADNKNHRTLTAHVDTLGAMVKEIHSDGTIRMTNIGGFKWSSVEGEYCLVETMEGKLYKGTILTTQPSVHVYKDSDKLERKEENMIIRLDEKVTSAEEVRELGIEVGDFVSFNPREEVTESGFVKSRHLDDKASVAILIEIIKQLKEQNINLPYTTHFIISNNEEIGYGANSNISEETVEFLAVDMGAIGKGQTTDEFCVSICAKDSSGPYHLGFRKRLVALAKELGLNYRVDIYPYYGSDASAALRAGADIKHGLIGPGIAASHSHERTHKTSLEHTFQLVYSYILSDQLV